MEDVNFNLKESTSLVVLSQNRKAYEQDDFIKLVRLLIDHKVGVNCKDAKKQTALHYLCRQYVKEDLPDIVRLLISGGIDVNCKDEDGENAIFHLVQNQNKAIFGKVFRILLRHGIGYCHDRCADKCFKILDGICDPEVVCILKFWAEEDITLGWHLKCDDCKQILWVYRYDHIFHWLFLTLYYLQVTWLEGKKRMATPSVIQQHIFRLPHDLQRPAELGKRTRLDRHPFRRGGPS